MFEAEAVIRKSLEKLMPQGLKALPFVSCHMKDNVEVIHFHVKINGVQDLVFVPITCEKWTTNFNFENGKHNCYFILR